MIGIEVAGEFLDVPANVRISFKLNNPLLGDDIVLSPGSGSYTFELPGEDESPHNARILGNPDVLENPNGLRKFNAQLYIDGIRFKRGQLIVRDATPGSITVNFNWGLTQLSDDVKTKKLRDLLDETMLISSASIGTKKIYLKPGALGGSPYQINVNGRAYEAGSLGGLATAINLDTTVPRATAVLIASGSTPLGMVAPYLEIEPIAGATDPLTPLSVDYTQDNGNGTTGFVWMVEAFDMATYRAQFDAWFAPYATGTPPNNKIKMPLVYNGNPFGENIAQFLNIISGGTKELADVNRHSVSGLVHNDANFGVGVNVPFAIRNVNSLQPFIRARYVLDQIATWLGTELEGDWFDADVENMLIDNSYALDVPMEFIGKKKFVFWRRSFNLRELVPDITVIDFLKGLQSRYNLGIGLSEITGNLRFTKREEIAKQQTGLDITARAGRIKGRSDERLGGIRLEAKRDEKDTLSLVDEFVIGDAETKITSAISGISIGSLIVADPYVNRTWGEKFELRMFYFTGLNDREGITTQTASINATQYNERFDGVNGLYEKRWKYWLHFIMRRRVVKLPVNFYLRELNRFEFENKVVFDRKLFLVSSIDAEVNNQGLGTSDVELYTMF